MRSRWLVPLCLNLICAVGLISALLGDGIWDALSWIALAVPAAISLFFAVRVK